MFGQLLPFQVWTLTRQCARAARHESTVQTRPELPEMGKLVTAGVIDPVGANKAHKSKELAHNSTLHRPSRGSLKKLSHIPTYEHMDGKINGKDALISDKF